MPYVDGYVLPVKHAKKDAYVAMAKKAAPLFHEYGALHVMEAWGSDIPKGETTDFFMAVKAQEDRQGDSRRRVGKDDEGRAHAARRRDAVRRQAHVLGRIRAAGRHAHLTPPGRRTTCPSITAASSGTN